jgi:hypothetical protein
MDFGIVSVFIPATGAKSDCPSFHLSWAVSFPGPLMKLTHKFAEMTPEKRPQDPNMDGTGLRFETMEHGWGYPDTMPQAIKLIDAEGRSCIYVPITQNGKVVDSQGYVLDLEDE